MTGVRDGFRHDHCRAAHSPDMDRNRFVRLGLLAFGLILASFLVTGTTRLFLPVRYARLLASPAVFGAAALLAYLFVWGILDVTGIRSIE